MSAFKFSDSSGSNNTQHFVCPENQGTVASLYTCYTSVVYLHDSLASLCAQLC